MAINSSTLKKEIKNAAKDLIENGLKSRELRSLQYKLHPFKTSKSHLQFMSFFLFLFIDELYYNLTGDFPYEKKSCQIRHNVFTNVGQSLDKLADGLDSNTTDVSWQAYLDMVHFYIEGINQISALDRKETNG